MESYRILIIGDASWQDSFDGTDQAKTGQDLCSSLQHFIGASDSVIVNLGAPLAEPAAVGARFKEVGVEAVSLANTHALDHDSEGLDATFRTLSELGIAWFGAGRTLDHAQAPYRVRLPESIGGGQVHLHGYLQYSANVNRGPYLYADENSAGSAPLRVSSIANPRNSSVPKDSFHVAMPSWTNTTGWRSQEQFTLAHRFLNNDYDLVLGQGSTKVQEIHRKQQRWIVYSTGNGRFDPLTPSEHCEEDTPDLTVSLWTMLELHLHEGRRRVQLKLYPIGFGGPGTDAAPGPVTSADFDRMNVALASRPLRPWRFDNPAQTIGTDELGHHITLDLGEWPAGSRPARLGGPVDSRDPADWPLRSPGPEIEDKILGMNTHLGAAMLALGAESAGGEVHWLTREAGVVDSGGKSLLVYRYRNHESSLGATIVLDKVLTGSILEAAGVPTPKTVLVKSANAAVRAAATMPGPVVVKPRYGVQSKGVSIGLVEDEEIRRAYRFARDNGSQVLVQQHIESAEELRVMASPHRTVAVNGRALPHVVADGVSTIQQLIDDKNLQRTLNPSLEARPIPIDELTYRQLERLGLTLDSVPELGQKITVRNVAGLSVGGDTIQVLEETDPRIKEASAAAIAAIPGLGWGGVDVIIEESTGDPYVIEINTQAAYGAALFPAYGKPLDVGNDAWNIRFAATSPVSDSHPQTPERASAEIPIGRLVPGSQPDSSVRFRTLFAESLTRQNYPITRRNLRVLNVTTNQGHTVWVTRGGLTGADRSVVQRIFQRHQWVAQVLEHRRVPKPRSRTINSVDQLRRFTEGGRHEVILMPVSAAWAGPDADLISAQEALSMSSLPGRMWVQSRPHGPRLRILATQKRAWVVTAGKGQQDVEEGAIQAASLVAVQAVRAVPELRWAAVDLFLRPRRIREFRRDGVLVEGLSIGPAFSAEDRIIAGNFDAFCSWIVEAEDARTDEDGSRSGI